MDELPKIGEPLLPATVVSIRPGDVIMVRSQRSLMSDQRKEIQRIMRSLFPDNECIFVYAGLTIEIVRPEGATGPDAVVGSAASGLACAGN